MNANMQRILELMKRAEEDRRDKDWREMHINLSEAFELAGIERRKQELIEESRQKNEAR